MKEYKIITGYASSESVEQKMNDYAKIGYVLDSFKTIQGGSYSIVIIMSRESIRNTDGEWIND